MALNDYAELDEEDFYGQDFEKQRVVSVWAGLTDGSNDAEALDVLQDLCGVGYYDLDFQEGQHFDFELVPLHLLLEEFSYSSSFISPVLDAAKGRGAESARYVLVQYDFQYDPSRIKRPIASDPVFLGVFHYQRDQPR
jgi:hypothetical protein